MKVAGRALAITHALIAVSPGTWRVTAALVACRRGAIAMAPRPLMVADAALRDTQGARPGMSAG
jgi:hypothetical protein